jgi:hypothetical protein
VHACAARRVKSVLPQPGRATCESMHGLATAVVAPPRGALKSSSQAGRRLGARDTVSEASLARAVMPCIARRCRRGRAAAHQSADVLWRVSLLTCCGASVFAAAALHRRSAQAVLCTSVLHRLCTGSARQLQSCARCGAGGGPAEAGVCAAEHACEGCHACRWNIRRGRECRSGWGTGHPAPARYPPGCTRCLRLVPGF